jgi:hypothetical protein
VRRPRCSASTPCKSRCGTRQWAATSLGASQWIPTVWQQPVSTVIGLAVSFVVLFAAPKILARRPIRNSEVVVGAVVGAVVIAAILSLAGVITSRFLTNSSAVYGAMTTVVAFISVLFLTSNVWPHPIFGALCHGYVRGGHPPRCQTGPSQKPLIWAPFWSVIGGTA